MQSRVRMSQICGQAQATWSQAGHLTPRASEPLDTVSSPATSQKGCEGLRPSNEGTAELGPPAAGLRGAGAGSAHGRTLIVW